MVRVDAAPDAIVTDRAESGDPINCPVERVRSIEMNMCPVVSFERAGDGYAERVGINGV